MLLRRKTSILLYLVYSLPETVACLCFGIKGYRSFIFAGGGEAIRLKLCQLFLGSYNVLILDEQTNFLAISTRDISAQL